MAWFKEDKVVEKKVKIPEGTWIKCDACAEIIYRKEVERNYMVCPKCTYHFRISARERISLLFDEFEETHGELAPADPLQFVDTMPYGERVRKQQAKTGLKEALICGNGRMGDRRVKAAVLDFGFMGGSMGRVVGQKIVDSVEEAIAERLPFISVSSSGGARMQEGIYSLMQMAKTSAAVARLGKASLPFISILTDPTFGGVTASFAMLGDVIIAEPRSLVGFAGPRVIEQTIKQTLPEGFQRAEFLLEHGMIDMVVERKQLRATVAELLTLLA
ncbi:MAG: acetyl-CoA carboxylase, carboxyltransferase subunit beta [Thermodesulfobacteriota bacterium]